MSLILQIETATTVCSVAIANNREVIALTEVNERNIHAEKITVFIEEACKSAGIDLHDLDAVAISKGPGSYTGLRIGVSTAKGICFALDKPLIAVDTLAAMAGGAISEFQTRFKSDALLCPMIDARRMEVYTALFDTSGKMLKPVAAEIIEEASFENEINGRQLVLFGDGAEKCADILSIRNKVLLLPEFSNSAAQMTHLAADRFAAGLFEDVAYFEPYYLKEFIAGKKANS
ncbi:tRNA (adenosine(37)-N6)-threonylcarbamoyltransferase complex dimerization subunit type 1 TsaB [Mucilaginibacter sp. RS28]|uniref:tRNA (Adenosine(37)-N6)-threonylcarbamoyltransferase complex dimerization subunit type 1 TsaB n=1 Tax=Mucilaginibacter straminoryzae TaxID=2932774 RepID=A0A9X1X2S8_9SPHI|nr:tRNA (adenosine(37)-N6)-threonylcarbamoyltransferase complex dimerization subunit type 1 TsaB [Mucilaginibacter straminoryzae]MCJ8208930.1 tRNA (adenosine(37)-N6)-threonylcarbamoyltransferase complex dimerization subunit type 1 TsaB [Mucilaginibacter straminoryzae]